jgi:hypothetical protein
MGKNALQIIEDVTKIQYSSCLQFPSTSATTERWLWGIVHLDVSAEKVF